MDKRSVTFLVVSMLVLMVYWIFVMPLLTGKSQPPAEETVAGPAVASPTPTVTAFAAATETPAPVTPALTAEVSPVPVPTDLPEPETYTLETSALELVFSTEGGSVEQAVLKEYKDADRENLLTLLKPLTAPETDKPLRSLAMSVDAGAQRLWQWPFEMIREGDRAITFRAELPTGLVVTKTYRLPPEDPEGLRNYHLDVSIEIQNVTDRELVLDYDLYGGTGMMAQGSVEGGRFSGVRYLQGVVKQRDEKKLRNVRLKEPGDTRAFDKPMWVASRSQYFASLLEPLQAEGEPFVSQAAVRNIEGSYVPSIRTKRRAVSPGGTLTDEYRFYMGPLLTPALKAYPGYVQLQDYGFFGSISVILLAILHAFYRVTHNYGFSIILLTLLIRLVLFPLSRKQAISSYKMQKLQPLMTELRDKYKTNKQKLNQEMMALYKEQGVNPLAGCLPMVFQLPVFCALQGAETSSRAAACPVRRLDK